MAELATIARPYAEAVFELADKANDLAGWSDTLKALAGVAEHPEVKSLIGNPKIGGPRLVELIGSIVPGSLSGEARRFLEAMVVNGRLPAMAQVSALFEDLKNERESRVEAHVTSAFPISEFELGALVADLERRFKRKVQPVVTVDPSLIGGAMIVIGDEVIDGSVRGQLTTMANALAAA